MAELRRQQAEFKKTGRAISRENAWMAVPALAPVAAVMGLEGAAYIAGRFAPAVAKRAPLVLERADPICVWATIGRRAPDAVHTRRSRGVSHRGQDGTKNLETNRILKSIPCDVEMGIVQSGVRIGELIDGLDRWWRNDPNGPAELAEAVRTHALPWFEQFQTLGDQAAKRYGRGGTRPWRSPNIPPLAVTFYPLGEIDEALALFDAPIPKTAIPNLVAKCKCVQRWLQEQRSKTSQPR